MNDVMTKLGQLVVLKHEDPHRQRCGDIHEQLLVFYVEIRSKKGETIYVQ